MKRQQPDHHHHQSTAAKHSLLNNILDFSVSKLKKTTTRVRTRDGKLYEEQLVRNKQNGRVANINTTFRGVDESFNPSVFEAQKAKPLSQWSYDKTKKTWCEVKQTEPDTNVSEEEKETKGKANENAFTLLTFNVWFAKQFQQERTQGLLDLIVKTTPDIMCFQEVTAPFLDILLNDTLMKEQYVVSDASGTLNTVYPYGVFMCFRKPQDDKRVRIAPKSLHLCSLPTNMARRFLRWRCCLNGRVDVDFGTVHLESLLNTPIRCMQLKEIYSTYLKDSTNAVVCGDFNFSPSHEEEEEALASDNRFCDLWVQLRQQTRQQTMHYYPGRIDRVLVASTEGQLRGTSIDVVGQEPIQPQPHGAIRTVHISDHLGLLSTFKLADD